MTHLVTAGFVPLVDSAVLVVAREKGFADDHGIELALIKQPSWASLRDHLNLGHIDCAHALAPLPIAAALGIGQVTATVCVPFVLSRGGNAITVSQPIADDIRAVAGDGAVSDPVRRGQALAKIMADRSVPLTFGMVYPFSGHNFELRYWLAAAGIHPDRDVRLVSIPPPLMVESLRAGQVDGFCVGEPWNSLAAAQGIGEILVSKSQIFPQGIEKVLAVPDTLLDDRQRTGALLRSLSAAAAWCDDPGNHAEIAALLSRPEYLDVSPELSLQALNGLVPIAGAARDPDFMYFSRYDANRPRAEEALWIYAQMLRWGQLPTSERTVRSVARIFRSDVYDDVFGALEPPTATVIPSCDGVAFDPSSLAAYLARFRLSTPYGSTGLDQQTA